MRRLIIILALLLAAAPVFAGTPLIKTAAGVNGIWFDDNAKPSDFELGGNAAARLSPHISLVGAGYYGFQNSYLRGSAGFRVTATDVEDENFSVDLGMQYHLSSEPSIRPEEWAPDASFGWRPWPVDLPKIIIGAQGSYGLESNKAYVTVAVRYILGKWGSQ